MSGKTNEQTRNNHYEEGNKKYWELGYLGRFNAKKVFVKLSTGELLYGTLATNLYNRYDAMLRVDETQLVALNKGQIVWVSQTNLKDLND